MPKESNSENSVSINQFCNFNISRNTSVKFQIKNRGSIILNRYTKVLCILCLQLITVISISAQESDSLESGLMQPTFENPDSSFTQSGSFKLSWNIKDSVLANNLVLFELHQSHQSDFDSVIVLYQGSDLASYISGLAEGTYHYRVRSMLESDTSDWSDPITVVVKHHSLQLAFLLFGIGAIVFLSTVIVVVRGSKKEVL